MTIDGNHIYADAGKVLRRKGTDEIFGDSMSLGYSYYIGGVLQNPPHLDVPEDFEEIPDVDNISDTEALNIILGNDE